MLLGVLLGGAALAVTAGLLLSFLAPVIIAAVLGAVLLPVVDWACRRGLSRTLMAILAALFVPALLTVLTVVVISGVRAQGGQWPQTLASAAHQLRSSVGTDALTSAADNAGRPEVLLGLGSWLVDGVLTAFMLAFSALIAVYVLFFLLKDGHRYCCSSPW